MKASVAAVVVGLLVGLMIAEWVQPRRPQAEVEVLASFRAIQRRIEQIEKRCGCAAGDAQ